MLRSGRQAYSTLWWVGFLTFCLVPLAALSVGLGRYFYARAEVQKAADAAALAAAQEVDLALYRDTGQIELMASAGPVASSYAAMNSGYLATRRIYPQVTGITVDQGRRTVQVSMAADASSLFPSVLGGIVVRAEGEGEVRLRAAP
jgi:Flp pilus assembly protein TadG